MTATVGYKTTRINIPASSLTATVTATVSSASLTTGSNISFISGTTGIVHIDGVGDFGYVPLTLSMAAAITATVTATEGYMPKTTTSISTTAPASVTKYINSVTVTPGQHFVINVPNGSSYISFRFSAATNGGNVYIDSVGG